MRAVRTLLDNLDRLVEQHGEIGDTEVRERMAQAVFLAYVEQPSGHRRKFSYFCMNPIAEFQLRRVMKRFFASGVPEAHETGLESPQSRYDALCNPAIRSARGSEVWEYFGPFESYEEMKSFSIGYTALSYPALIGIFFLALWELFKDLFRRSRNDD